MHGSALHSTSTASEPCCGSDECGGRAVFCRNSVTTCCFSSQVSELYDLARKWEPVSDSLPHITERLSALQQLHEQGDCADFAVRFLYGNVDLYSAIITKVADSRSMLVSGEKPGFQALSKRLIVLLCAEVVRQGVPDHGAVHSECSASNSG